MLSLFALFGKASSDWPEPRARPHAPQLRSFSERRFSISLRLGISAQTDSIHSQRDLRVAHKPAPDTFRAQVLSAQQDNPDVNADHVCIHPSGVWIKGVDKTEASVDLRPVLFAHGAHGGDRDFGGEH